MQREVTAPYRLSLPRCSRGVVIRRPKAQLSSISPHTYPKVTNTFVAVAAEVMARGTFANVRIVNKLMGGKAGPKTIHMPDLEEGSVFDVAARYKEEGTPTIILAGAEYGSGSSRDWAAKGTFNTLVRMDS